LGLAAGQSRAQGGAETAEMPIVPADEELAGFVRKLRELIKNKQYDHACEIANAMIQRTDAGFYRVGKTGRFRPIRAEVNDVLASMPEEGLQRYRTLFDAQAKQMISDAIASGDISRLRKAVNRYRHTSHGRWAMRTLAEMSFDRGQFLQASWYWQELLPKARDASRRAMLQAQIAVASHLAGEEAAANKAVAALKSKHAEAEAEIAGRRRNLLQWVGEVRRRVQPDTALARHVGEDWPGLWSLPGHVGLMEDVDVVLRPNWRMPETDLGGKDLSDHLVAHRLAVKMPSRGRRSSRVFFRGGQARYKVSVGNQEHEYILPGTIHPVVRGNWLIFRGDKTIYAYDVYTGEMSWMAFEFPMYREGNVRGRRYSTYMGSSVIDYGRYALTVGGGRVYAIGAFQRPSSPNYHIRNDQQKEPDDSALAAFSLEAEGTLVWQVGHSPKGAAQDQQKGLPGAKYISAPTYYDGRLYVLARYMESYWLLCLNAEDGRMVWKTQVAQTPAPTSGYSRYMNHLLDIGTPPSCADGRVFALTNAGALACFDTETGQPIWAHQYDSRSGSRRRYGYNASPMNYGMNPIIVTPGKVSVLPADSDQVMTFAFEDGKELWTSGRNEMLYLSAVDENRLVLSGSYRPGKGALEVLSSVDGKVLHRSRNLGDVYGRPAVTNKSIISSTESGVVRVSLANYKTVTVGPSEPDALLGNLVCAGGKMFAANPLGVAAYFPYETQYEKITEMLAASQGARRLEHLEKRAGVSFSARYFEKSLTDFLQLEKELETFENERMGRRVRRSIYRNYIALANTAEDVETMGRMLEKANRRAHTPEEKAHMLLRLAKYHAMIGDRRDDVSELTRAIDLATEVVRKYPDDRLVDVPIGPADQANGRFTSETPRKPGAQLAHAMIARLIEKHGHEPYRKFDEQAAEALAKAREEGDPEAMVEVARTWKHSQHRDDAQFAAAEIYYLRARAEKGQQASDALTDAVKWFSEVNADAESPLKASAAAALAAIYAQAGKQVSVRYTLAEDLGHLPDSTKIEFANFRGTLGEFREQIQSGQIPVSPEEVEIEASITPPLQKVFQVPGTDTFLLRDQHYRPIRIGQSVLCLRESRAPLINTTLGSMDEAITWEALTGMDVNQIRRYRYYPPDMSFLGGLSRDGKTVVIGSRAACTGFSAETGKRIWHRKYDDLGLNAGRFACMGMGDDAFLVADSDGMLICLEVETGKQRWENKIRIGNNRRRGRRRIGWPMKFLGRYVAIRSSNYDRVVLFDLETGKAVEEHKGNMAQVQADPDGMILLAAGDKLQAFTQDDVSKPTWERSYRGHAPVNILLADAQVSVVASSTSKPRIDVFSSMSAGKPLVSIETAKVSGKAFVPLRAVTDKRGGLLVVGTTSLRGNVGQHYGRLTSCRNYHMQRYDLGSGNLTWSRELLGNEQHLLDQPLQLAGRYILATAVTNMDAFTWLIDVKTGKVARRIEMGDRANGSARARVRSLSIPAVTSGRLAIEDTDGITIYRGK
jgi:outer membrane protein assembly factor BamB/tetratricopeptide (TPR) repeat protein